MPLFRFWRKKKAKTEPTTAAQQYEEERARKKREFDEQAKRVHPIPPTPHPPPERTTWQNAAKRLISQNNNLPFSTRGVSESIRALAIIEEEKAVQRRKFIEESYEIFIQTTTDIKAVPVDIWLTIFNSLNVIELGRFLLSCTFFSKLAQLSMERRGLKTVAKYIAMREKKKKEIMHNFYQDLKDNKVTKNPFLFSYGKTINFQPTTQ